MAHSNHPTSSSRPEGGTVSTPVHPDDREIDAIRRLTDRRGVLKAVGLGVGIVTGAGVLAACSSPPVQPDTPAQSPTPLATPGGGTPSPTASAAGGRPTSEIPVGGGLILAATKTVVTQPTAGTFKAFDTTCPHAGCAVTQVVDGKIDCPCHGSAFDISSGDRVAGPAPTGLTAKTITVTGGTFTVA
ncbi:MAG: Rieske 2Fe-2S domain-containing protein [Terracoccus sp.]